MKNLKSMLSLLVLSLFLCQSAFAVSVVPVNAETITSFPKEEKTIWKIKRTAKKTDLQKIAADLKNRGCNMVVSVLEYDGKKIKSIAFDIKGPGNVKVGYKNTNITKTLCIELISVDGVVKGLGAGYCGKK